MRCRKATLRWFGHVKRRDEDYVGRKTGDGTICEKKKKKKNTEAEMDGLCQTIHESCIFLYRSEHSYHREHKRIERNID